MKLQSYITEQKAALEMEDAIVAAWNIEAPEWPKHFHIQRHVADSVVAFLKKKGVHGATAGKVPRKGMTITKNWAKYGAKNNTPKTDFKIGTYKISLKTGPRSQLMSGSKTESAATFHNVVNQVSGEGKMIDTISGMIDQWQERIVGRVALKKARAKEGVVKEADQLHKEMSGVLNEFFTKNTDFRNAFAREAMAGEIKFGSGSHGSANVLLKVLDANTGKKNSLNSVDDSKYVNYIANQMNINVRWKSNRGKGKGKYRYWSVLSLALDKMNEEFDKYEGQQLNEGIISAILTKIKLFLTKLFQKIKQYLKQGVEYVMDFLEIEPDVSVKTEVKF